MKVQIVPGDVSHVYAILQNLRDVEAAAVRLLGNDATDIVVTAFGNSMLVYTGLVDDEPVVMCGVNAASPMSDSAFLWLIASRDVNKYPISFLRHSRRQITKLHETFNCLYALVDPGFQESVRFFDWLGFQENSICNGARVYVRYKWTQ